MLREFHFENRTHLFTALTAECQDILSESIIKNDSATLLVSGGSTPVPLYDAMAKTELPWQKITVALVDERWVDPQHDASNEALIKRSLLTHNATPATFVGMKTADKLPSEGQQEAEARYRTLPQPFSVALIGMGNDGHTASLFPHATGLAEALHSGKDQLTAAITAKPSPVTGPNIERLTMTPAGLLKSERIIILLTGEDKLAIFDQAMKPGPIEDMPIRVLLQQEKVPLELYWAP